MHRTDAQNNFCFKNCSTKKIGESNISNYFRRQSIYSSNFLYKSHRFNIFINIH